MARLGRPTGLILAFLTFAVCLQATGAEAPRLSTDKDRYAPKEKIVVRFQDVPGNRNDWITVVPQGMATKHRRQWTYLKGKTEGSHGFRGLQPGAYEVRLFVAGSRTEIAARHLFTVGEPSKASSADVGEGERPSIGLAKDKFAPGEAIDVRFANLPGNQHDWIALAKTGARPKQFEAMAYLRGAKDGVHAFQPLLPGSYEVRLFLKGGFSVVARQAFTVADARTTAVRLVRPEKPVYAPKEPVIVVFANLSGTKQDTIAIVEQSAPPDKRGRFTHTKGRRDGQHQFSGLMPGVYEVRLLVGRDRIIEASAPFIVSAVSRFIEPAVTADAVGALGRAKSIADQCRVMVDWLNRVEAEFPGIDQRRRSSIGAFGLLFGDAAFVPLFGRPYDGLDDASGKQIVDLQWYCSRALVNPDRQVFTRLMFWPRRAFGPRKTDFASKRLPALRAAARWLDAAKSATAQLPPEDESLGRLDTLVAEGRRHGANLWPSERNAIGQALVAKSSDVALAATMKAIDDLPAVPASLAEIERRLVAVGQRAIGAHRERAAAVKAAADEKRLSTARRMIESAAPSFDRLDELLEALAILDRYDLHAALPEAANTVDETGMRAILAAYGQAIDGTPEDPLELATIDRLLDEALSDARPLPPPMLAELETRADRRRLAIFDAALTRLAVSPSSLGELESLINTAEQRYGLAARAPDDVARLQDRARGLIRDIHARAIDTTPAAIAGFRQIDGWLKQAAAAKPALSDDMLRELTVTASARRITISRSVLAALPPETAALKVIDAIEADLVAFPYAGQFAEALAEIRDTAEAHRLAVHRTTLTRAEDGLGSIPASFAGLKKLYDLEATLLAQVADSVPMESIASFQTAVARRAGEISAQSLRHYREALSQRPRNLTGVDAGLRERAAINQTLTAMPPAQVKDLKVSVDTALTDFLVSVLSTTAAAAENAMKSWKDALAAAAEAGKIEAAFADTAIAGQARDAGQRLTAHANKVLSENKGEFARTTSAVDVTWSGLGALDEINREIGAHQPALSGLADYRMTIDQRRTVILQGIADQALVTLARSGRTPSDLAMVVAEGEKLAAPFEARGQNPLAQAIRSAARERAVELLRQNLTAANNKLAALEPTRANVAELRRLAQHYVKRADAFADWTAYADGAKARAEAMLVEICDQAVARVSIIGDAPTAKILGADGTLSWRSFVCGLDAKGHQVAAFGRAKTGEATERLQVVKILQSDKAYSHVGLKILEALPGQNLYVGIEQGDAARRQPISVDQWRVYAASLLGVPVPEEVKRRAALAEPKYSAGQDKTELVELLKASTVLLIVGLQKTEKGARWSSGTGFFVGPDIIMTNQHVVPQRTKSIYLFGSHIGWKRADYITGTGLTGGAGLDVALVRVKGYKASKFLKFSTQFSVLQDLVIAGYPGIANRNDKGYDNLTNFLVRVAYGQAVSYSSKMAPALKFSFGKLQGAYPNISGYEVIQHSAQTAKGNSGSAVVNLCGEVVGIHALASFGGKAEPGQHYNYAYSVREIKKYMNKLNIKFEAADQVCGN